MSTPSAEQAAFAAVEAHWTALQAMVLALVREDSLSREILSDLTLEIVRDWDQYDPTRSFMAWAHGIARHLALASHREREKIRLLPPEEILEPIAEGLAGLHAQSELDERTEALRTCLTNLPSRYRRLIQMKFFENLTYPQIAAFTQRTLANSYVVFGRIVQTLNHCILQKLKSL